MVKPKKHSALYFANEAVRYLFAYVDSCDGYAASG